MESILIKKLKENKDLKYKEFNSKIISTKYPMIGVKTPILKNIAKEISKKDYKTFLQNKNTDYYETVLIEGFVISHIKDIEEALIYFDKFIKKIDNWAICDMTVSSMKIVKKNKDIFKDKIKEYLNSKEEFTVRVGIILLLDYYLEEEYLDEVFSLIDNIKREEYYINMAISWLISIALIKYKDKTLKYLKVCNLDDFTYNKALQKARESKRISKEDKKYYQKLKRK